MKEQVYLFWVCEYSTFYIPQKSCLRLLYSPALLYRYCTHVCMAVVRGSITCSMLECRGQVAGTGGAGMEEGMSVSLWNTLKSSLLASVRTECTSSRESLWSVCDTESECSE